MDITPERAETGRCLLDVCTSPAATRLRVAKGTHVYNCGDQGRNIYMVESGQVKTVIYSREGKRCVLSILAPGDVFGELCLIEPIRSETATAMKGTVLRCLPSSYLLSAMDDDAVLEAFLTLVIHRIQDQQRAITDLVTMDSERRLASTLLRLARKLGKPHAEGVRLEDRITQEELSGMVGTTRSRVGYFLKRFTDAGFIKRMPDSFLVLDVEHLSEYVEDAC